MTLSLRTWSAVPAVALLALTSSAGVQLHIVDSAGGPGSDFTDLQVAIDAAQDGDILLLRTGFYGGAAIPFGTGNTTLTGKGLHIVEEQGATASISGLAVSGVPASSSVTLRGLNFQDGAPFTLTNCDGVVWVEDCEFGFNINGNIVGMRVENCAAVHVNRSSWTCAQWISFPNAARVVSIDSNLHLYDTTIIGCGTNPFANFAMSALAVDGGYLYAAGSTLQGGAGCSGSGLLLSGASPLAEVLDSTVVAGSCVGGGTPDVDIQAGNYEVLPGVLRSFEVGGPYSPGETMTLTFSGQPGDFVFLDIGLYAGSWTLPFSTGIWQMTLPYYGTFFYGNLDATGEMIVTVPAPSPAGPIRAFLQADLADSTTFEFVLTGGSFLLITP